MGCGSSTEAPSSTSANTLKGSTSVYDQPPPRRTGTDDVAEIARSSGIDRELDRARQQEEGKVKLLLLGAGESGKSTVFKQMRILHGTPRSDDDLRMYGVVIRSNIIVATRKLCAHLRNLELEDTLNKEPAPEPEDGEANMTPWEAYAELIANLVDNTASLPEGALQNGDTRSNSRDWVGQSPRAGLAANNDSKQFLQHAHAIRILWQVRVVGIVQCKWSVHTNNAIQNCALLL
jgi:G-protein alpha subunit